MATKMSRSPWMWAFLIMFMVWGIWILLPQPDHLSIDQATSHLKTWANLGDAHASTSPNQVTDLEDDNNEVSKQVENTTPEKVTEDSVVAEAIKSLLEDQESKDKSDINIVNADDEDEDDNNKDEDEEQFNASQTIEAAVEATLSPTPTYEIPIAEATATEVATTIQETSNGGVGIVVQIHDEVNKDEEPNSDAVPSTTVAATQGEATSAATDGNVDEEEDAVIMSVTAVSWAAAAEPTEL